MDYPFVNEEALEPEIQVLCVPIFRKNELWAFFEIPALALDRYADRKLGQGMMFVPPKPTSTITTGITPHEASPVRGRRRRVKEKPIDPERKKKSAGEAPRAAGPNTDLPEVPPRGRKKKGGAG